MSKLNQAKERLSRAFADLEVAMLDKINQVQSQADKEDQDVNHFHNEINSLQNELSELGIENEKLRSFKSQAKEAVNKIRIDLLEIKKIINSN